MTSVHLYQRCLLLSVLPMVVSFLTWKTFVGEDICADSIMMLLVYRICGKSFLIAAQIWSQDRVCKGALLSGHGIPVMVDKTTYMGTNVFHATAGLSKLLVYQCLVEDVKMDIDMVDPT